MDMARGGTGAGPEEEELVASSGGPVVLNQDGRVEVFTQTAAGEIAHRWQTKPGQGFNPDWSSLGKP